MQIPEVTEEQFGLPKCLSGKESTCQCRRCRRHVFNSWMGKYPGKEMANNSTILVWRILLTEEPQFSSIQFSHSVVSDSLWPPWAAAPQASLSITNSYGLLKLMSIESVMTSNHLILYCPLLLLSSIFSSIRVFSSESALCIITM